VIAGIVLLIPEHTSRLPSAPIRSGKPQAEAASEKPVPVGPATRHAIDALLDRFVPAAVARKDPGAAYDLVTPSGHEGLTRAEWKTGNIPVYPYTARGTSFHGWTVDYSYRDEVALDLFLQPLHPHKQGTAAYRIDVKRVGGRWLVDWVYPVEVHGPQVAPTRQAAPSTAPVHGYSGPHGRLSPIWFIVPATIGGLILLLPLLILGTRALSDRRLKRRLSFEAERAGRKSQV
jgi:hypothetical protein